MDGLMQITIVYDENRSPTYLLGLCADGTVWHARAPVLRETMTIEWKRVEEA